MALDFTNTVIDYFANNLQNKMNQGIATNDPRFLQSVVRKPLQDDPTARAFYLEIGPDTEMTKTGGHWRMPSHSIRRGMLGLDADTPVAEIGGGFLMVNFFRIEGWTRMQGSREAAYAHAGELLRRLERSWAQIAHQAMTVQPLATNDGNETTEGVFQQVFNNDGSHFDFQGGDNEWYTQLYLRFHVFSRVNVSYWLEG